MTPRRSRTDYAQPVTKGWKAEIPPEVYHQRPLSPVRRWSAEKSSASQSSTTVIIGDAPKEQTHEVISPTEEFNADLASALPMTTPESDLPLDASAQLFINSSRDMLARAAKMVFDEGQIANRMRVLSSMLESNGNNMQGETLDFFEKLFREMKEEFFELDSQTRTVKQFLGECEKQDSETIELVGKHKVPQSVYLFLRFLAAKEIQRKRHHIFQNGGTSPTMRVWKQKLRDETRRRIRLYLFGEKNALEDHIVTRSVDDCNVPVQKISTTQKKKQKLREQGRNLNSENQKRKRARKAAGSEKQPEPNLFEQAKKLLIDFEKLVADNAKYGNFNEAIAAAIKRGKKADSRESESDIVHMVEQGQNNHGLTQLPEGPQPGSTPADFREVVDQVDS